jgi:hypothetical protein
VLVTVWPADDKVSAKQTASSLLKKTQYQVELTKYEKVTKHCAQSCLYLYVFLGNTKARLHIYVLLTSYSDL